jgi:hypothetical protein
MKNVLVFTTQVKTEQNISDRDSVTVLGSKLSGASLKGLEVRCISFHIANTVFFLKFS